MSARTKVRGNRAIRCDIPGCDAVHVAAWWGNGAAEARLQAQDDGWRRRLILSPRLGRYVLGDACPSHVGPQPAADSEAGGN